MMRIITGKAKGVSLLTLPGLNTRPTAERVKEAIFSALQFDLAGRRVLDLFAGSGQLALEALSRGAESAYLCDQEPQAVKVIENNIKKTGLAGAHVLCCSYQRALEKLAGQQFDLVFLDPPYQARLIPKALLALQEKNLLAPGALLVCEDEQAEPYTLAGCQVRKHAKYGRIYITILEKEEKGAMRGESFADGQL
ncbi:MAG: 16S rRNA (guanine(966)-N(2))-methyltransferase RsmD [Clostridiales bacterium]|nr:16S rRNA (guanine(966)-N(2))-methyltransferase RsmD [Clostridiales bacterium]